MKTFVSHGPWVKAAGLLLASLAIAGATPTPAAAGFQSASYVFDTSSTLGSGNFGTVLVESYTGLAGTFDHGVAAGQVRFTVTAPFLAAYGDPTVAPFYGVDGFAFNTDLSIQTSQIEVTRNGGTVLPWEVHFSKEVETFGVFSVINKGLGSQSRGNPITITVSDLGDDATIDRFKFPSADPNGGIFFVAHVAGFRGIPNTATDNGKHFITVTQLNDAPEPASLALALIGLTGLGMVRLRRKGQAVVPA